jgi:ferredoxin
MELGADLVGIGDGAIMDANPPFPDTPRRPSDISELDGGRVIVLAKRLSFATSRLPKWDDQHKYYSDELVVSAIEEMAFDLVFWLEDNGCPAILVPSNYIDPLRSEKDISSSAKNPLSAVHAAVEAGLGTLGLNHQLITPEYGPRVLLGIVMMSANVTPDAKIDNALCLGPECGRCLQGCPGDAVGHWDRDWTICDRHRSPFGFGFTSDYLTNVLREEDQEKQLGMLRSMESSEIFQAMLRGTGIISGCRNCADVCPVGEDYERLLKDWVDEIAEATPEKQARLDKMIEAEAANELPPGFGAQQRWIGNYQI